MRAARLVSLILTAHGSADPRAAAVAHALAGRIRRLRPELDVHTAFLEQSTPNLLDVLGSVDAAVVTPMLLAHAYHARVDIPAVIDASGTPARQARVLGEDPALLHVVRQRLADAGVSGDDGDVGVVVAAVGTSDAAANARTASVATALQAGTRWAGARVAFATGPRPTLADATLRLRAAGARRLVIAPWFLAHGRITDRVAEYALAQGISMAQPLGSHNLVAATLLDRYDSAVAARVAA
jgi:sirohydrochlorin ferrochelatase